MKTLYFCAAMAAVSACAKMPDQIAAADIGGQQYDRYSCKQLAEAKLAQSQNLSNLSAKQKAVAEGDAVGVALLGMPLSSMSGGDQETNIAVTKGHIEAIDQRSQKRGCAV
tara:strand:- start:629 stop:961 length:333 start_codon:yes stop_codon:yes gene_type:complete